jgi:hypothetical protein
VKLTAASTAQAPRHTNRGRAAPYRLVVLAPDTADVVAAAGGLIVDAVRSGWHVEIYLETEADARALRILGVDGRPFPPSFEFELDWPDAVVFAAPMYGRQRQVRRFIAAASRRPGTDVTAWGGSWPTAPVSASVVEHRLSSAAGAFKLYAMKALGVAASSSPVEAFHGGFLTTSRPPRRD